MKVDMKLQFSDGMKFNTEGKLHVEERSDGFYVVGNGMLIPVNSEDEGNEIINKLRKK